MGKRSIVYIHCHDTGRCIQPYGCAMDTPNLLALAGEGVQFRQMHCAAPTCSPSRAALLTGQWAHSAGMFGLVNRGFELEQTGHHLAAWLGQQGYNTILSGVQHVVFDRNKIAYRHVLDNQWSPSLAIARDGLAALDADAARPFFADFGFFDTHHPLPVQNPEYDSDSILPPPPLPDIPEARRDMAGFKTGAKHFDEAVGAVLDGLRERGLLDNTLVICTTDHGIAFPGMKCSLTCHGTGVFCLMRLPGVIQPGSVSDALASQIDLFPTICALTGLEPPDWLQGKSLLPLLTGEREQVNEAVFAEVNYHCNYEPQRAVRTARYAYIRRYTEIGTAHRANCDESLTKEAFLRHGWGERTVDAEQLYDTFFDPTESHNLAGDARYAEVLRAMRARLDVWQAETADPILKGRITAFATNTPDGGVYVSDYEDVNTYDLWQRQKQPEGYA